MNLRYPQLSIIAGEMLDILNNNGGTMKDKDLYEILRRKYEITYSDFLKYLMVLEIRGLMTVSTSKEDIRVVSVNKYT